MFTAFVFGAAILALGALSVALKARWDLSRAKHWSLTGHARIARRIAALVPSYEFTEAQFFSVDHAPRNIVERRRAAFSGLSARFHEDFAKSLALTRAAASGISDLQFTAAYRVPFPFSRYVRAHLPTGSFLASSSGVTVTDLDGNVFLDLTGAYGVNLLGHDFYKSCIARGAARVHDLGAVLGAYHPVVADNVERLRGISGLDEVSFHMSGTEAVMQAVRLARYHTRRSHLVRFCGAYHGWWGDVQPGIGNPAPAHETYTLEEMSEHTLRVLRTRRDIACVLVNPIQALHPNAPAPADSALIGSNRRARFDRRAYTHWLEQLRLICDERRIVLIFDEVFVGFRLAAGGAREYFGVQPDLVTYGKTLGGGLPVGVLCGRRSLMKRYRDERPADVCFARGTFNAHPYVMGAMHAFLQHISGPQGVALYTDLDRTWNRRAALLNERLSAVDVPVRVVNLSSIWTVCYTRPCRYNWMLQYYLRAERIALSWVGTGRLVFSLNFTDEDFVQVSDRFVAACQAMERDGWWWSGSQLTDRTIKRQVIGEMWRHRGWLRSPGIVT